MALPGDFFTLASFSTLAGLTGITYVVTNTLRVAFNLTRAWIGLLVAMAATTAGMWFAGQLSAETILVGLLNACLVFLTAAGSAHVVAANPTTGPEPQALDQDRTPDTGPERPKFFGTWFGDHG